MGRSSCGAVALKRVPIVNANATFVTIWAVQDTKKKSEIKEDVLSLLQSLFFRSLFLGQRVTLPHKSLLVISAILCQQILCDGLKQIFNVFKKITDLIFEIVQTHDNGDSCLGFILPKSSKTQNWFSLRPHSPAMKGGWVD